MNISFKKNLNTNYMVIEKRENFSEHSFSAQMIRENKINTLLDFSFETIDDKTNFLYDISSRQALLRQYEINKMTYENLRALCFGIKALTDALEEFLLEPNDVVMKKECIFTVPDGSLYEFCYCPGYNGDIILELSELFNYVLQVINYEDDKAVRLAYEIHQRVQAEYFTVNDIMDALNENTNLVPLKIEELDDELIEFEEVEMTPFVEAESNKTFFERVALYLKGRNFIDVLDDINNKEFMYKVNEYRSVAEPYLLSQSLMEDADGYNARSNVHDKKDYAGTFKENLLDEIEFVDVR